MKTKTEKTFIRPENLLESLGIDFSGLDEEERTMQRLLVEEYKKSKKILIQEVKKWREKNSAGSLGDAIRALFKELE